MTREGIYWDGHSFNDCEETSRCSQHRSSSPQKPNPRNEPTFFTRGGKKYIVPPANHRCTRDEIEYHGTCEYAIIADSEGWGFAEEMPASTNKIPREVTVYFTTSDRYSQTRKFKTLNGARAYAQSKIGKTPEVGGHYAVSSYGDAKIEAHGATMMELFPDSFR